MIMELILKNITRSSKKGGEIQKILLAQIEAYLRQ